MKKILLMLPLAVSLAACETTADQNVTTGALTGAAVGAIASDDGDKLEGAVLGGAAGAAVGSLVTAAGQPRQCIYRYANGTSYRAPCP
ncbi:MAG: hypothetical protein KDE00_00955 [Rhodobacteraceae bacterium]|nr:hypothetical protein [Paracoccaceae bacterium]